MSSTSITVTITPPELVSSITATISRTDTNAILHTDVPLIFNNVDTWEYAFIDPGLDLTYKVDYVVTFTNGTIVSPIDYVNGTKSSDAPPGITLKSYVTLNEADDYLINTLDYINWSTATDTVRIQALNTATRNIDALRYKWSKTDPNQLFQFPRNGETEVPVDIKDACILLAGAFVSGIDPEEEFNGLRVASESYTNIKTTYVGSAVPEHIINGIPCISAWRKIKPYLAPIRTAPHCRV